MVAILHERFHKKTFVSFARTLMSTLNWKLSKDDTINNPSKGVQQIEELYATWTQQRYWDQMTQDLFFTTIYVQGLDAGPFRTKVLTELTKIINGIEKGDDIISNNSNMPIWRAIKLYVADHQRNREYDLEQKQLKVAPVGVNNNGHQRKQNNYRNSYNSSKSDNAEEAAAAAVADDTTYNREVSKGEGIMVTTKKGRKVPYMSHKELTSICDKCFPVGNKAVIAHEHGTKCYQGKCNKCDYYGHNSGTCKQTHKVNGDPIA